ncbi:LysR family transcriptional regulator [Flavimaricola marinus]|uniref:HTH-type transcriptional regulator TfdS n=1 Tax=Flavimaricola marinus TaxID=1819565 RepID=A0A238LD77_9RHOB|nr:LysR family transcriptional regulator [Flavimaricola marinus]SMY07375.1 HTH-type transcriptional regulator TfdS [Flavimaricola marinus]
MHRGNWDDLRYVLAVAESGSVSAASRRLGVNHATVLRRISAFEETQGAAVFDRSAQGYSVLPDKLRVIEAARGAALAMDRVDQLLRGDGQSSVERIRITSTDTFCLAILPEALAKIDLSDAQIELCSSNNHIDLSRLRADIAVRPAMSLPGDMTGDHAADLGVAVYGRAGTACDHWLGLCGSLSRSEGANWMADNVELQDIRGGADSFVVLRELAAHSTGRTILPCCLGDPDPRLERLDITLPVKSVPVWVACHADLAEVPRLQSVRRRLAGALGEMRQKLLGSAAES